MNTSTIRSRRRVVGALIAVGASVVLAVTAVGVVAAATPTPAAPTTQTDVQPAPVPDHPSELLDPTIPAPELDPVGDPADTFDAEPPQSDLRILSFSVSNTQVLCNTQAPHEAPQHIAFTWDVVGAERVFFGVDTIDAQAEPMFVDLPHSGQSHTEFPAGYEDYTYACPVPSHQYTLTAVDDQGHAVSATVTVVNNGDTTF